MVADLTAAAANVTAGADGMERGARLYLALKDLAPPTDTRLLPSNAGPSSRSISGSHRAWHIAGLGLRTGLPCRVRVTFPGALSMLLLNELGDQHGSSTLARCDRPRPRQPTRC